MEHLSDFVFIKMGNLTLVRHDAYLSHLGTGIKQDTLTALRTAALHLPTLFPDATIKRAEEDIAQYGTTLTNTRIRDQATKIHDQSNQHGKPLGRNSTGKGRVILPHIHHDLPRASSRINDNYCITKLQT